MKDIQYYFCEDTNKFVKYDDGFYSLESNGKWVQNRYYDGILIGEIWVDELNEGEFNDRLSKSNVYSSQSTQRPKG